MPATQEHRPFRLKTPLGDDALLVDYFQGSERISTPFRFVLKVLSMDPNVDMKALMNAPAVLAIVLNDGSERYIHGNINRMKLLEYGEDGYAAYELEMVAWFWFLNLFHDCRIFQNKSVPDIVEKVFQDRKFKDYKLDLRGSYPEREYCVQYRETDFNFVSRLLEEEGIFYYFEQTQDKHILVLADQTSTLDPCAHQPTAHYVVAEGGVQDEDTVNFLEAEYKVEIGTASLNDYNFEKPTTSLFATLASEWKGEYYDYPGRYKGKADGDRYARVRLEEQEVGLVTVRGSSNCMGFECGYKFTLADHYRDSANADYTMLAIEHHGRNASYRGGANDPFDYGNRFEAIPNSVPFRPPRSARKPIIPSTQTAVVVGKSGEEIWTDKYGRVKVQFYWDREGKLDENSSCWIRVSQGWAGKQWGAIYIPRIGQEVVVSFLEGDPDRPLITGRVYNADQTVPYSLPDEQTKSTLKSMSSKGGGGFNEIRFEDKKGDEQVFIHGQKDLDIRIENDRKEWIGEDRHLIVQRDKLESVQRDYHSSINRDQLEQITRDHSLTINGKQAVSISGSQSVSVTGNVTETYSANHAEQVTSNYYLQGENVVIEATTGLTINVGGNFITIDSTGVTILGTMVMINSGGMAIPGTPGNSISPTAPSAPLEADKANPGDNSVPTGSTMDPQSISLSSISSSPPPRDTTSVTHNPNSPENQKKKDWIAIQLKDETGQPVPGERYRITLPDGTVDEGTLDDQGKAKVQGIDPGNCVITFPDRDKDAWKS